VLYRRRVLHSITGGSSGGSGGTGGTGFTEEEINVMIHLITDPIQEQLDVVEGLFKGGGSQSFIPPIDQLINEVAVARKGLAEIHPESMKRSQAAFIVPGVYGDGTGGGINFVGVGYNIQENLEEGGFEPT